jgi:transposase
MHSKSDPRRRHSAQLKAKVLAACDEPGASISGVAQAHGLNANLVHKWRTGRGLKRSGITAGAPPLAAKPEFVAIEMAAPPKTAGRAAGGHGNGSPSADPFIHVELRRGPLHLSVRWPASAGEDCTAWLRDLTTGLLK